MWDEASTITVAALSFIGALAGANLLARQGTRRLRVLRAEAELVTSLPAGPGKDRLAALVDQSVSEYVDDVMVGWTPGSRARRFPSRWARRSRVGRVAVAGSFAMGVLVFIGSVIAAIEVADARGDAWSFWVLLGAFMVVAAVTQGFERLLDWKDAAVSREDYAVRRAYLANHPDSRTSADEQLDRLFGEPGSEGSP